MSSNKIVDLYELLPALYRVRDVEQGFPLRALTDIVGEQADILKRNIDGLWDDLFIETCADWVIPYIGDLVGNNLLYDVVKGGRADVAKTISYRRRKGTLPMLEELARDVTGWGAHAVTFFELLGWTQNLNHLRYQLAPNRQRRNPHAVDRVGTVNLRKRDVLDRVDGPFDITSHTVDVRTIGQSEGWHNIRNVGFFLWRLRNYPVSGITPGQASLPNNHGFHFSPLGNPAPLFNKPQREADATGLAREIHVPGPIRPVAFHFNPEDYYGPGKSLAIYRGPNIDPTRLVPLSEILCKDLTGWAAPPASKVAVDVRLGRLAFKPGEVPADGVTVSYNYGFSADIGGGPYNRLSTLTDPSLASSQITVAKNAPVSTLQQALTQWTNEGKKNTIIEIADNAVYAETITMEGADDRWLVIQARDGLRPTLRLLGVEGVVGNLTVTGDHPTAALTLNGLLIEGGVDLQNSLGELNIVHCTLVPGRSLTEDGDPAQPNGVSLIAAETNRRLRVNIHSSIAGAIRLPQEMPGLTARDCVLDGLGTAALARTESDDQYGPPTTLERATVFGSLYVQELTLGSEVIFTAPVVAQQRQSGCVRYCYVPKESRTPPRYRCQPDLALEGVPDGSTQAQCIRARLRPSFASIRYGHPSYAQLGLNSADQIRTGAKDGSEMGTFSHLKQPQREANLRIRLEEYLPFGLKAGMIFVT